MTILPYSTVTVPVYPNTYVEDGHRTIRYHHISKSTYICHVATTTATTAKDNTEITRRAELERAERP
jgi:ADP-ribose pyrophosphatase YjhB (NUDIX family)